MVTSPGGGRPVPRVATLVEKKATTQPVREHRSNLSEDVKIAIPNLFTELKEIMIKEVKGDIMTLLHQIENINKEI